VSVCVFFYFCSRTTLSEEVGRNSSACTTTTKQFDTSPPTKEVIITFSKRKLTPSETETSRRQHPEKLLWQTYQSQQQLQNSHSPNPVEEGIRRKLPSSSEISLPAEPLNIHAHIHVSVTKKQPTPKSTSS